jgi:hypothetical protein
VTASSYSHPRSSLTLPRAGGALAALGASLGVVAGVVELVLGPHMRSWVGNKQDTTRLGFATLALSAIALLAALTWLRRQDAAVGTRLLIAVGLLIPGAICFTTAGRAWYLPGGLLVVGAGLAGATLLADAHEVVATVSRSWLAALMFVLGAFYVFLGATALGLAGALGISGGVVIIAVAATSTRTPMRARQIALVAAALPFALLTWWSVVTPALAILVVAIGWCAVRQTSEVEVRLRGDRLRGHAVVAADAAVARTYLERYPRARAAVELPSLPPSSKSQTSSPSSNSPAGVRRGEKPLDTLPLVAGRGAAWLAR